MNYNLEHNIDEIAYDLYLKSCGKNEFTIGFSSYLYIRYYGNNSSKIILDNYIKANNILRKLKLEKLENVNR